MNGVEGQPTGSQHQSQVGPHTALRSYLLDQLKVLEANLPLTAAADPEGVHNARVALRRFRSVAACFRFLLPDFPADDVGLLRELARGLGESRDAEVQAQRLSLVLDAGGPWHREESLRVFVEALRSLAVERAAAIGQAGAFPALARVSAILGAGLGHTGRLEVTAALQARWEHVGVLMERALQASPVEEHHVRLHTVRKAIKGLRYSAEAVTASFGEPALAIVRPATALQRLLGEQHDAVVASALLTDPVLAKGALAKGAAAKGALAGGAGLRDIDPRDAAALVRLESRHAVSAETEYLRLWLPLSRSLRPPG